MDLKVGHIQVCVRVCARAAGKAMPSLEKRCAACNVRHKAPQLELYGYIRQMPGYVRFWAADNSYEIFGNKING